MARLLVACRQWSQSLPLSWALWDSPLVVTNDFGE